MNMQLKLAPVSYIPLRCTFFKTSSKDNENVEVKHFLRRSWRWCAQNGVAHPHDAINLSSLCVRRDKRRAAGCRDSEEEDRRRATGGRGKEKKTGTRL